MLSSHNIVSEPRATISEESIVTLIVSETVSQGFKTSTQYVPGDETRIVWVEAPVDHVYIAPGLPASRIPKPQNVVSSSQLIASVVSNSSAPISGIKISRMLPSISSVISVTGYPAPFNVSLHICKSVSDKNSGSIDTELGS